MLEISYVTYSNFETGKTKSMHPATMRRLEKLIEGGGANAVAETPAPYPDDANGAIALLAKDLRHLADILDSPDYPKDFKIDKFVEWITFTHKELKSVLRAMGKLPEKDPEQ